MRELWEQERKANAESAAAQRREGAAAVAEAEERYGHHVASLVGALRDEVTESVRLRMQRQIQAHVDRASGRSAQRLVRDAFGRWRHMHEGTPPVPRMCKGGGSACTLKTTMGKKKTKLKQN